MKHACMGALAALASTLTASVALGGAAVAAPGPPLPLFGSPTGLSLGTFLPSSGAAKAGGNTQYDLEFRYGLPLIPNPTPLLPVFGLGVETGSKNGSHSTVVPLTAGLLVGLNGLSPNAGGSVYGGGGVGVYYLNQHSNSGGVNLSTSTRVGGFAELGYSVTSLIFVDAKYQFVDRADGLTASVGLRF